MVHEKPVPVLPDLHGRRLAAGEGLEVAGPQVFPFGPFRGPHEDPRRAVMRRGALDHVAQVREQRPGLDLDGERVGVPVDDQARQAVGLGEHDPAGRWCGPARRTARRGRRSPRDAPDEECAVEGASGCRL